MPQEPDFHDTLVEKLQQRTEIQWLHLLGEQMEAEESTGCNQNQEHRAKATSLSLAPRDPMPVADTRHAHGTQTYIQTKHLYM